MIEEDLSELSKSLNTTVSSELYYEVHPQVKNEFEKLSQVLSETNQNLLTFEFMLAQYKEITNTVPSCAKENKVENEEENEKETKSHVYKLLSNVASMVQKISETQRLQNSESSSVSEGQLSEKENDNSRHPLNVETSSREELMDKVTSLTTLSVVQKKTIAELQLRISEQNEIIVEERQKNRDLEIKLKTEKKAAHIISTDISNYVDKMKSLEMEVKAVKEKTKERLKTQENKIKLDFQNKLKTAETQHRNYEMELSKLRSSFENLKVNMEDFSFVGLNDETLKEILSTFEKTLEIEKGVSESLSGKLQKANESLERLRLGAKRLLKNYKTKVKLLEKNAKSLSFMKASLIKIESFFKSTENDYHKILFYIGSQIENIAKLLAAYLNIDFNRNLNSVSTSPFLLVDWFCDLQALSLWIQKQLVAFGIRYWTGKEGSDLSKKIIPFRPREDNDYKAILDVVTNVSDVYSSKFCQIFSN